jgi:hypothetical protein
LGGGRKDWGGGVKDWGGGVKDWGGGVRTGVVVRRTVDTAVVERAAFFNLFGLSKALPNAGQIISQSVFKVFLVRYASEKYWSYHNLPSLKMVLGPILVV